MECLEAKALKSSFHWELAMKSAQQDVSEEAWYLNGANLVAVDDFEVDEFFNFSNGDFEHGSALRVEDDDEEDEFEKDGLSVSSEERLEDDGSSNSNQSGGFLAVEDSKSLLAVELAIPGDALADLEWVSQFVDDSCSEFSLSCPAVKTQVETQAFMKKKRSEPERRLAGAGISCFLTSFPVRPRTKRPRQSRQARSTGSSLNQSPSSSSSSTSSGVSSAPQFIFTDAGENVDSSNASGEPPKKPRKKAALQGGGGGSAVPTAQIPRRCSHCLVQKTPQWRTGPNGAKTLCNACGVRYKSGRLFPEYRPALSPTFCSGVHSNSHRKVLEMRKVKETPEPATELTPMVPSY